MIRWQHCRLSYSYVTGALTILSYADGVAGDVLMVQPKPPSLLPTEHMSDIAYTFATMVAHLGSEGWEAFHVSGDGQEWYFKRPTAD